MSTFPAELSPAQLLFSDVQKELETTRRVLERVPDGQNDWAPHEKSMSLGRLATHVAELPGFTTNILTTDELDWATNPYQPPTASTTVERLALFDAVAGEMQRHLANADWDALTERWVMRSGDQVFVNEQKGKLIRSFCISHLAHHRAQLGVYLRLLDVPVPSVYGPTADEG